MRWNAMPPKIAWVCCTYLRPKYLGHLIHCFLEQDYPRELRSLVILDDAGQFENQAGDGWKLFSIPGRFATLGQKRNAAAALVPPDVQFFSPVDDDDFQMPHAMSASAKALDNADFSIPGFVYQEMQPGQFEKVKQAGHHGSWAYRRWMFEKVSGYPAITVNEDGGLKHKMEESGAIFADPIDLGYEPYTIYTRFLPTYATHTFGRCGYNVIAEQPPKAKLVIEPGYRVKNGRIELA